ncbi:sulfurtransferase [Paenibacillus rhizoplanae]
MADDTPLPDTQVLASRLSKLGIGNDTRIVAYDDENGMNAARLWWLLRYLGHEQVYILEGGFSQWKEGKYPVTDHQPVRVPSSFVANVRPQMLAGVEEVREVSAKTVNNAGAETGSDVNVADAVPTLPVLIDSRAKRPVSGYE